MKNKYSDIGFFPADILFPQSDLSKWSVVACDQYTSQPEYWAEVRKLVGNAPSALNIILPEAELDNDDPEPINRKMDEYLQNGLFKVLPDTLIYLTRTQADGKERRGLVGMLDLECYDYHKTAKTLCRATEGTVEERLPPRIRIREGAKIEMPHIMVLINDPNMTVIEALEANKEQYTPLYDFELMQNGGHLTGYALQGAQCEAPLNALRSLKGNDPEPLLFAMGDGNHSLATAKACYERIKQEMGDKALEHPARYCLIELVNLHSPALEFEAIHRVVFNTDTEKLMAALKERGLEKGNAHPQQIEVIYNGERSVYSFAVESSNLAVGSLQNALDELLPQCGGTVDYIHGIDVVENLTKADNSIGFLLPDIDKKDLFPTVIADGALPRKTFSMGHAHDKRFYLECRRIEP